MPRGVGVRVSSSSHPVKQEHCGNSSVGRAQPCQGWGREFESRFPLCSMASERKEAQGFHSGESRFPLCSETQSNHLIDSSR